MITRYELPEMSSIWNDEYKIQCWINIEIQALKLMMEEGVVPKLDVPTIQIFGEDNNFTIYGSKREIPINLYWFVKRWKEEEANTHHDIVAFLHILEQELGPEIGKYLHHGMTSSDLCDTEFS